MFNIVDKIGRFVYKNKVVQFYIIYSQLFMFYLLSVSIFYEQVTSVNVYNNSIVNFAFSFNLAGFFSYNHILWRHKFCSWSKLSWFANTIIITLFYIQHFVGESELIDYISYIVIAYFSYMVIRYYILEIDQFIKSKDHE